MKKAGIYFLSILMVLTSVSFFSFEGYAKTNVSVNDNKYSEEYFESNSERYEKYISYDDSSLTYSVNENAEKELEQGEYKALVAHVDSVNKLLKDTWRNANAQEKKEIDVIDPNGNDDFNYATRAKYKEGVTKVTFHWWGTKIYIKKSHLRAAGKGLTVGGIWIPHKVLSKVAATGGVALASAPGGIIINRTYVGGFKWASFQ
ncbi:hypothetical protein P3U41_15015 (plasmid) [Mammaliicoccus sciuri]|uniref:hypothetical protein n=1 Tax=Mammaliicoccus sciuri TaxID=1296 RepID=UPI002B264691|nr:hypothetical protein [Mammaliicoccus sciuri]WQL34726.1 hypothetical protein P3U41_15015 [Mammaliicoccus sciuri]